MAHVVCELSASSEGISFTWREGASLFTPYTLTSVAEFRKTVKRLRAALLELVKKSLHEANGSGSRDEVLTACSGVAQRGHELYHLVFLVGSNNDQATRVDGIRRWLCKLHELGHIESLQIIISA